MKGIIKEYLESQARIDECFKAKYNPEHLDYCIEYLYKNAEKLANKEKCVAVKDETVFKWARDYFNDGINVKEEEERNKPATTSTKTEDEPEESESELQARIEESRKKAEEERKKREEKERSKREHANGQMTIFDILGG